MKKSYKSRIFIVLSINILLIANSFSQSTFNNNNWVLGRYLGWNNTNGLNPLQIRTNNINRMQINGIASAYGVNTSGFIGIGTSNPASPLHIIGSQQQAAVGWNRGLTLSNNAALVWDGSGGEGFIMAHPSSSPTGNFFAGVLSNLNSNSPVNYAYTVYVNQTYGGNPQASTQFFKNVLIYDQNQERKFGVNVISPALVSEIFDGGNTVTDAQLRLSTGNNAFTDFRTQHSGSMIIMPKSGRVGITYGGTNINPTANLDVSGDVRIRSVQTAVPDALFVGKQHSGASDLDVRRLDFNSNPNTYLGGDGQFHPITTPPPVNNVIALDGLTYYNTVFGLKVITLGQNVGQTGDPAQLFVDREIPMNNHNLYFTKNGALNQNHIGIGYIGGALLPAKLSVNQLHPQNVTASTIAVSGINNDVTSTASTILTGVEGKAIGVQNIPTIINRGGYFTAQNSNVSMGLMAEVPASAPNIQTAIGGHFNVSAQAKANYGVFSRVTGVTNGLNCGVSSAATGSNGINKGAEFTSNSGNTNAQSIGMSSFASGSNTRNIAGTFEITPSPTSLNIAVAAKVGNNSNPMLPATIPVAIYGRSINLNVSAGGSYAGFFDGDVFINGPSNGQGFALTSDQQFKTNIDTLSTIMADSILMQLKPKTFFFDTTNVYGMNFSSKKQYGLIAQDVEPILPELISNQHKPAMVDTSGNIAIQAVDYKSLNYNAFISILIKGHQEQQAKIDSLLANSASAQNDSLQAQIDSLVAKNGQQDVVINDLNNRLTQLENCLGNLLPLLCQLNQSMIQTNNNDAQQQLRSLIRVDLNDNENIVLDQNVPNPFAESTIISYSIPASVQKAQIHFYNLSGRLMKVVDITDRGAGQLNVFGQDLSSGVYTYTLVADGRIIDTKKMVKEGY